MSHFLTDRPYLWHGNLMKLILTVGLLSILAVSEIKAQTDHSITTEFAMSASTEASITTPAQVKRVCQQTHISVFHTECEPCISSRYLCYPSSVLVNIEHCSDIEICRAMCIETYTTESCCHGFWGVGCVLECPGGKGNPCNGHGKCSSTLGGCVCDPGFKGAACELCTDVTKYGPNCSLGDNPCQSSVSPCGNNSQCIHTGPGRHRCVCDDGYAGDGTECAPINPCQNNSGGCDVTTDCIYTGPNQHKCQCKAGFEGDNPDKGCTIKDMCRPGICGPNAVCETREPLKHRCVCNKGYLRDGTLCAGNIIKKLEELNTQDTRFKDKLHYMVNITTRFYSEVLTRPGPLTMFVPTDQAFRNVMDDTQLVNLLGDDNKLQQILRQHIVAGQFMTTSSSSFYNLQGNLANLKAKTSLTSATITYYVLSYNNSTRKDTSHVVEGNIEAWNGIIHVINDVLGMEDVMFGGTQQETAMEIIKNQADYSTMYSMIMAAGLSELFSRPKTTVLIANNEAWDSPILLEKYYLKNEAEGRGKLDVILKHHVFPGIIDVTDLITTRNRKSYANIDVKVHLSGQGQILLDYDVKITKANIPVKTGRCHRMDKVLVPSYLIPLVNNVCHVEETKKVEGYCVKCSDSWKHSCPLSKDTPTAEMKDCYGGGLRIPKREYIGFPIPDWILFPPTPFVPTYTSFTGPHCYRMCLRTVKKRTCCKSFYGHSCLPCPGGSRNPCSGNGKCSDGDRGTGVCSCNKNFVGSACNQCANEMTFGPHCNEPCTCQFGQCDSGPEGTGQCRSGTCKFPYNGQNCDTEMVPCESDDLCPVNAKCYKGEDGIESCHCLPGYEEDGDKCSMIDLCAEGINFCHQQAQCTFIKEGERNCTCPEFMVGDGITCRQRTIAEEIMKHQELDMLSQIMEIVNASNNILDVVNSSYTFFAPNSRSILKKFKKHKKSLEYWSQEENALTFLKFHIINNSFSSDDLMAMDGVVQSYPTLYDGYSLHTENIKQKLNIYSSHSPPAVIKRANISAVNGYIHIINQVLVPFIPDSQQPSVTTLLSSKPKYKLFYEALQKTNVLETLSSLKEYTLFVFPNNVVQHMKRDITADFLKYHILPHRVSTNAMQDKTVKDTILGSRYRLSMKRLRRKIYVNGVAITRPNMWTDKGVVHEVPEFLRPVNNQCDLNINGTPLKRECCGGYFGPACYGCPGGPEYPCSGNGVCDDGVSGSGKCKCNHGFSGEFCGILEGAVVVIP